MNTLQKATENKMQDLADWVIANMEVLEMTKQEAIKHQRENSCFTDKIWVEIEKIVDEKL
jgi:hypothetical protein